MTIHPLGENGFLVEINSDYIQQLYKERDEALARNRELEQQLEARIFFIKNIASNLNSVERERDELLMKAQVLEEEKAGLECCYDVERKAHTACIAEKMKMEVLLQDILLFLPYDGPILKRNYKQWDDERNKLLLRIHQVLGLERS